MEGPAWELRSPLLAPDDVVKLRTAAKERNKGSKCGPYGDFSSGCRKSRTILLGDFVSTTVAGGPNNNFLADLVVKSLSPR